MCELTLLYAPNINSYKRFQAGSFAPTSTAWGYDNRTCSLRVVGHGAGMRLENRLPGGDVNPYLAMAGMLASGLRGHRAGARARAGVRRQRLRVRTTRTSRRTLQEARDLFHGSASSPARRSATRWSTTTPTTPTSSSPRSTRR